MKRKYIFVDIDGTLFDHKTGIPRSAAYAIRKTRKKGNRVFICTGRAKSEIPASVSDIGFDGCICSSGSVVEIEGKLIFMAKISPDDIERILGFIEGKNMGYVLEGYHTSYMNPIAEKYFSDLLKYGSTEYIQTLENQMSIMPIEKYSAASSIINKISLFSASGNLLYDLNKVLDHHFRMILPDESSDSEFIHAEITLKQFSKATGVDLVLEYYSESLEDTICFGDSLNDVEMIEHCKIGICMGNGVNALKKIANDITATVQNNGLYKGFRKYELL